MGSYYVLSNFDWEGGDTHNMSHTKREPVQLSLIRYMINPDKLTDKEPEEIVSNE